MTAGPVEHAGQQTRCHALLTPEALREALSVALSQVGDLDTLPNVEGCHPRVVDEVGRRCHADQTEDQPV